MASWRSRSSPLTEPRMRVSHAAPAYRSFTTSNEEAMQVMRERHDPSNLRVRLPEQPCGFGTSERPTRVLSHHGQSTRPRRPYSDGSLQRNSQRFHVQPVRRARLSGADLPSRQQRRPSRQTLSDKLRPFAPLRRFWPPQSPTNSAAGRLRFLLHPVTEASQAETSSLLRTLCYLLNVYTSFCVSRGARA